jgi:hypothetical protein
MALGNAHIAMAIDGEAFVEFDQAVHEVTLVLIEFLESTPTRSNALYHVLNKPWEPDNWRWLLRAPTKRKVRQMRADWEHADHCRRAAQLLKSRNRVSTIRIGPLEAGKQYQVRTNGETATTTERRIHL